MPWQDGQYFGGKLRLVLIGQGVRGNFGGLKNEQKLTRIEHFLTLFDIKLTLFYTFLQNKDTFLTPSLKKAHLS